MKGPIAVLTTGRQDWGILRSTCLRLREEPDLALRLLVGGLHNSKAFGDTYRLVEADGFTASERPHWISSAGDDPACDQAAGALRAVGAALARQRPRALVLAGDRLETASAGIAATLERVPIVHLHGGEETAGAFDDVFRHAITKLSHLHLVSHPAHRERVIALGEDPATVHVVGAPSLDNARRGDLPGRDALEGSLGCALEPPLVLVTLHPATAGGDPRVEAEALCVALDAVPATYLVMLPNSDPGHVEIRTRLSAWAAAAPRRRAVAAVGERAYWGLLKLADAMVGNSSSGLVEAPSVGLPAVNVGDRQAGRIRGANVVDVPAVSAAIADALRHVLSDGFRRSLAGVESPFGDGLAAERIVTHLRAWDPPSPLRKPAPGRTA